MKISERWLRRWVNPPVDTATLADALNMAGHECEFAPMVAKLPQGVVVARVTQVGPHPEADRLKLCRVQTDAPDTVQVVCGAPNVEEGMRVALARHGATLPDGTSIVSSQIRGQQSDGMLCSSAELGLAEQSDGILELDPNAALGSDINAHLELDDKILDLELTPNRGDCLSIAGLARDIAAIYGVQQSPVMIHNAVVLHTTARPVAVADAAACPHYAGRMLTGVDSSARTPDWMRQRLQRSGIRCLHPLVDITNYVMLELGQPLHAFDNSALTGTLQVRRATAGEQLELLDGQQLQLDTQDLLIADDNGPLALAGIMGGVGSGVSADTANVFIESACFEATVVAKAGRRHKLLTEARHRFERGVDPALQRRALERVTALVLDICGGNADSIIEVGRAPMRGHNITLRRSQVKRLLGCDIPHAEVQKLLTRLGIDMQSASADTWHTCVPTARYDLQQEADLVEEVGRLYGYDRIQASPAPASLDPRVPPETRARLDTARGTLIARGYQEIVSYSFVDPKLLQAFSPNQNPVELDNPIAATMGVMRTTLLCGLVTTWNYNRQRQRSNARLFEIGACFERNDDEVRESRHIAGLIAGSAVPLQWGQATRAPDFYDIKTDVDAVLGLHDSDIRYVEGTHPALHDGCSARVMRGDTPCGWIGQLHPELCVRFDLPQAPVAFEINWDVVGERALPAYTPLSSQPSVTRDLALEVPTEITAGTVVNSALEVDTEFLRDIDIFDVYTGDKIRNGYKSIALRLIFQDNQSTLEDAQVDAAIKQIANHLSHSLGASIRGTGSEQNGVDEG